MLGNKKTWSYGVYSIQSEFDAGRTYTRSFIVIRDQYGLIVRFTNLEMFAGIYKGKTYRPNIQFWRGDKSPQSAFTYLQNKGDLNRQLEDATDQLLKMLLDTEDMQNGAI